MTCYSKRAIQLKEPLQYDNGQIMTHINIDCNQCIECLERRKLEWCFRMAEETRFSKTAYFTTLTYNTENLPYSKYGKKTLKQKDLTDFLKRLRHHHSKLCKPIKKHTKLSTKRFQDGLTYTVESHLKNLTYLDSIRYVACGEYGEEKGRPHYHAIIFNASDKHITKSWNKGYVYNVAVNSNDAAAYVMKYMDKKTYTTQDKLKQKEFILFSEGIGKSYIKRMAKWHKKNLNICYVPNNIGAMIPMPKYYREKIFDENERKIQVQLIENQLENERNIQIEQMGLEKYNSSIHTKKKIKRIKFDRNIKYRNYD